MTGRTHRQPPRRGFKVGGTPAGGRPRRDAEKLEAALAENRELRAENRKAGSELKKMGALPEAERKKNGRLSKIIKSADRREKAARERIEKLRDKCKKLAREVSDLKMRHGLEVRQLHLTYAEMMDPEENGICDEVLSIQQENKRLREEKSKLEARDRYNDGPHAPGSKKTFAQKSSWSPARGARHYICRAPRAWTFPP